MAVVAYENVPVFREAGSYSIEHLVGKANVKIGDDGKIDVIEIRPGSDDLTKFLEMGSLKAFSLSATVTNVDPEKAKEYWSQRQ